MPLHTILCNYSAEELQGYCLTKKGRIQNIVDQNDKTK